MPVGYDGSERGKYKIVIRNERNTNNGSTIGPAHGKLTVRVEQDWAHDYR